MKTYVSKEMNRCNYLLGEIDAVYHELSKKLGLSDSAMRILYTICDIGDCCLLQEICRRGGLSKQTVNSAIRRLEADGILFLKPAGAKNKKVCLTGHGKTLISQTVIRIIQAENEIFAAWPAEDVSKYLELTERYLTDLQEKSRVFQTE